MKRPRIFVSHASSDAHFVRDLERKLSADGVDVWLDEKQIRVGDSVYKKVSDGLEQCDFFAVVVSRASMQSKWVQDELSSAASLEKCREAGTFVLPLLLEDCEVPALLRDRRFANFAQDYEAAYQELLDAIQHHFAAKHPDVDVSRLGAGELDDSLLRRAMKDPEQLRQLAPRHFEELVAKLLSRAGYDTTLAPVTNDGGYDILASRRSPLPGLGKDRLLVQCKAYTRPVGLPEVQLLVWRNPSKDMRPVLITRTRFTQQAKEAAAKLGVDLIDAETLAKWIQLLLEIRKTVGEDAG